jgi:hypothetical protein
MIYYFIDYNNIFSDIDNDINKFCNKFDIEFDSQKISTKRELLIYYSILHLLNNLNNKCLDKPIIIYNSKFNNSLFKFIFNKISNILVLPIIYCDFDDYSDGLKKELSVKADVFYEKNEFTVKKVKKMLSEKSFEKLINGIKAFKLREVAR